MITYTAIAPAKINLQLRVFPKLETQDFHKVENTMQTLSLHDKLTFLVPESDDDFKHILSVRNRKINDCYGIKDACALTCENGGLSVTILTDDRTGQNLQIPVEDNLITKALLATANLNEKLHVEVFVEKNIPAQAGLGGGSSDAAATLQMTKEFFGHSEEETTSIATQLGSDVPYFLTGGRVKMSDTGTTLTETFPSLKNPVVLIKPECGVSTKDCYEKFDAMQNSTEPKGQFSLLNDLQNPACCLQTDISDTLQFLEENCAPENVLMTGSGSCCFAICDTFDQARKIATIATRKGYWARGCSCANIKASLID